MSFVLVEKPRPHVSLVTLKVKGRTVTSYIYPQGDIVWVVSTMDDAALAEEILASLP